MTLVKPDGMVGLLVPSGIASDKTAAPFFKSVATEDRLKALYDFENRRTRYDLPPFFADVDSRFKFCAFRSPAQHLGTNLPAAHSSYRTCRNSKTRSDASPSRPPTSPG